MSQEPASNVPPPSWAIISIRAAFLREAADMMARRASQLQDLGAPVRPLKGFASVSRMDLRSREDPSAVWSQLNVMEDALKEYDSHLDQCARTLAESALSATRSRNPAVAPPGAPRPGWS
jgi:hypothetical protein